MKIQHQIGLFIALTLSSITVAATEIDEGQTHFNQGQFEAATKFWVEALSNPSCQKNSKCKIDTSVRLSAAYLSLGRLKEAFNILESAQSLAENLAENDPIRQASVLMQLSDVYLAMRDFKDKDLDSLWGICTNGVLTNKNDKNVINEAKECLNKAELIDAPNQPLLWANLFNKKGNILMAEPNYADALSEYNKSLKMAKADQVLSAKVAINRLMAAVKTRNHSVIEIFNEAWQEVNDLPHSHDKAFALITLVKLLPHLQASSTLKTQFTQFMLPMLPSRQRLRAYNMLSEAIKIAEEIKDNPSIAYGKAYMAQLYAQEKRYIEAIHLTQQAIYYTQIDPIVSNIDDENDKKTHVGSLGYEEFQVYFPSLKDDNSDECREKCQDEPDKKLPVSCHGTCQTNISPLFLHNYYPEMLFRLERQLATFLKAQAQPELANDAYNQAAKYLQQVRQEYRCGSSQLGEEGEAFFLEVAYFLLESAKKAQHSGEKQALLKKVIDTIESLRETELQNYFKNICVTQKVKKTGPQKLPAKTAIFYPILFEKKAFLLLNFSDDDHKQVDQIMQVELDISVQIKKEAENLWQQFGGDGAIARAIENDKTYLNSANKLYQWLIKPITAELKARKIETLVIVPGSDLFLLPFAVLYDKKESEYLFQKYALAISPAWKLTDMEVMPRDNISALLMGLKKKSQAKKAKKFGELTYADEEITNIKEALEASSNTISQITTGLTRRHELLKDETFTISNVETSLRSTPHSIVHFSTHGHFDSDPDNTFLVAYYEVLTLDKLETLLNNPVFRKQPVELLTLSACQSAEGAEQGLAGIAIKTGTRSALATLWKVNDASTALLMRKFYDGFIVKKIDKAKALQEAQKFLLEKQKHPYYWAPFVLIGNWM